MFKAFKYLQDFPVELKTTSVKMTKWTKTDLIYFHHDNYEQMLRSLRPRKISNSINRTEQICKY